MNRWRRVTFKFGGWAGALVCGGLLVWSYSYPAELCFPKVVDAGELALKSPVHVKVTATNRTANDVRLVGGKFG